MFALLEVLNITNCLLKVPYFRAAEKNDAIF